MQRAASSQEQENSIQLNRIEAALMTVNANVEQLLLCWDAAADRENARTLERERTLERSGGEWTPPSTADTTWNSANSVNSMTPTQVPGGRNESYDDWWWRNRQRELAEEEAERWQGSHSWDEESTDGGSAYSWWQGRTDWWQS